jgi:hypothetical protein
MNIDNIDYRKLVTDIRKEIELLEVQHEDISRRLARLRQSLIGLAPLAEEQEQEFNSGAEALAGFSLKGLLVDMTITDSARQILQAAPNPLSPVQIKDQLIGMGKDFSGHKNMMASIHSLIKRLVESAEIETKDNGLTYSWKWKGIPTMAQLPPPPKSAAHDSGMRGNEMPRSGYYRPKK